MSREENVKIFLETMDYITDSPFLSRAVRVSNATQEMIAEGDNDYSSDEGIHRYSEPARVVVSGNRSFAAASMYKGMKTCVHNFANSKHPGGGVVKGATAQEECLCRCSTLYCNLSTNDMRSRFYEPHKAENNIIYNGDIIYTPDVYVFRTDDDLMSIMDEKEWYNVNVITCAAPNLRNPGSYRLPGMKDHKWGRPSDKELLDIHERRLAGIMKAACDRENEVMILGAFGCGAFANNPEVVAEAAMNVVDRYLYSFKTIEFAIYCSPQDRKNYDVFMKKFF